MSSSKLISKESLTAYERWELPNVRDDQEEDDAEELEQEPAELLTVEQLESIQQAAHQEGYAAGFEQGHREGLEAGQEEIRTTVQRLEQILHAMARPLEDVDEQVESELADLAIAIARQIIRRELKADPGQIISVVRETISALPSSARDVRVYLHPDDAAVVRRALSMREDGEEHTWRIVEEPVLTRGGCRVTTEHSRVDATVEKQLATVVAEVLGGDRRDDGAQPSE